MKTKKKNCGKLYPKIIGKNIKMNTQQRKQKISSTQNTRIGILKNKSKANNSVLQKFIQIRK